MNIPENLKYTKNHEWLKVEDNIATIGISEFAQGELGDIVFVEVDTEGESLDMEEVFGTIEAVKTVSDLFMPITGEVTEFNETLEDEPELINSSPYDKGWIVKVEMSEMSELDNLLSAEEYKNLIS
ncbi:glycine cleavage system protein GcvH [Flavobacteriales bacterium]|jgi:glycine cleavage system H protein|nr:glycine cleavage system protein GcvH [Flavobacteriales bacterium]